MLNFTFAIIVGGLFAFLSKAVGFSGPLFVGDQYNSYMDPSAVMGTIGWFVLGAWLSTIVRFVGPKRVINITFLGTKPMQEIKTGIGITLPQPFGWTHSTVHTDIQSNSITIKTMSKDKQSYGLEANAQWIVDEKQVPNAPRLFAFERDNARQQVVNIITAALISGTNGMQLEQVFEDKEQLQKHVMDVAGPTLKTFGVTLVDFFIEQPELRESTIDKLSAIREAEYEKEAATNEAEALYIRLMGEARAEGDSLVYKADSFVKQRMTLSEGYAASVALMQGKIAVEWTEETNGEGENAVTTKTPKFVTPAEAAKDGEATVPEADIPASAILEFFKILDGNEAIRDAASKPGTTVVMPSSAGGSEMGIPAALLSKIEDVVANANKPQPTVIDDNAAKSA